MWLSLLAYFILRVFIAITLLNTTRRQLRNKALFVETIAAAKIPLPQLATNVLLATEILIAFLMIVGLYTQYVAILGMIMCVKILILKSRLGNTFFQDKSYYFLLLGCFLSLLITGAGAFAFDLPL